MTDTPRCYAVRRLNPFMGVVEVVEIGGARAMSLDGSSWEIQVEAERPEHTWGRGEPVNAVRQFFRFGSWHRELGLSQVPVNPILDVGAMLAASERMISALELVQGRLPFPFVDHIERWLLDSEGRPLALLAATIEHRFTREIRADSWHATPAMSSDFTAPSLDARGITTGDAYGDRQHADILERQIHAAAGAAPRRCWYERLPDLSATPLEAGFTPLPGEQFPELPVRTDWLAPDQAELVRDYLHWLAPRLLTLDTLSETTRLELEQAACRHALQLADHFRLYPQVLQESLLDAARVEARLRRAAD